MAGFNATRLAENIADALISGGYSESKHRNDIIAIQLIFATEILDEVKRGEVTTVVKDSEGAEIGTGTGSIG